MTTRVCEAELLALTEEQLTICPHLFQEEISKSLEIRVIATKDDLFAFSTDAYKEELTAVDWRYGNVYLRFDLYRVSRSLQTMIAAFLEEMGLLYGVFDLIRDRDDQDWFLECNNEGQWYWLERMHKSNIPHAIAQALASGG